MVEIGANDIAPVPDALVAAASLEHQVSRGGDVRHFQSLRAVEDGQRITWRDGAPFADWVLAWGDPTDPAVVDSLYRVHRVVVVGGPRPAHFFAGALREGFEACGTDLTKLLPEVCRPVFDRALDFIYGAPLGITAPTEAAPLYKIADILQCPTLRNHVLDEVEQMVEATGAEADLAAAEVLVGAASMGIDELYGVLVQIVSVQAPQQLAAIAPVFMDRIACGLAAVWGGVEHEGGAVRLDGRVVRFVGGGTCIAWTQGEVHSGRHSWCIRVDEVHNASGFIALGVVAGPKDGTLVCDMDSWQQWYLYYSDDGKKRTKGEADLQDYNEPYAPGDIISVDLDLDQRTLEFAQNGRSCGTAYTDLVPGAYRVGAELGNSAADMKITLVSYDCLSSHRGTRADFMSALRAGTSAGLQLPIANGT